jgi:hypothetical protein
MGQEGVLFDTTPTPEVELILAKRFKFARLEAGWIEAEYSRPVHLGACVKFVQSRLSDRAFLKPLSLSVCMVVLVMSECRALIGQPAQKMEVQAREIETLPPDLDAWWKAFKAQETCTLVRDERAMRWLYFSEPFADSRKVLEIRKGSSLLGFVSFKLIRLPAVAIVELVDIAVLGMSRDVLGAIVHGMAKLARAWSEDVVYVRANPFSKEMGTLLSGAGFWRSPGKRRYYYFDRSKTLTSGDIHATPVDGDRSLFP